MSVETETGRFGLSNDLRPGLARVFTFNASPIGTLIDEYFFLDAVPCRSIEKPGRET